MGILAFGSHSKKEGQHFARMIQSSGHTAPIGVSNDHHGGLVHASYSRGRIFV